MTLKRQTIEDEMYNRLYNNGIGQGRGLRMTHDPTTHVAIWNIGTTEIWKDLSNRKWPPDLYPCIVIYTEEETDQKDNKSKGSLYVSTLPFVIEVNEKCQHTQGKDLAVTILERLIQALEIDEDLHEMDITTGILKKGKPLAMDFYRTGKVAAASTEGIVYACVKYSVKYMELYKGHRLQ